MKEAMVGLTTIVTFRCEQRERERKFHKISLHVVGIISLFSQDEFPSCWAIKLRVCVCLCVPWKMYTIFFLQQFRFGTSKQGSIRINPQILLSASISSCCCSPFCMFCKESSSSSRRKLSTHSPEWMDVAFLCSLRFNFLSLS